jgi:hypothetical protein
MNIVSTKRVVRSALHCWKGRKLSPTLQVLSDEDDEQQQGEGQYLLHPPRDLLYVVPLVRRRGFPPAWCRGRLGGLRPRCGSLLLLLHDHLLRPLRRRPRLAGPDDPD